MTRARIAFAILITLAGICGGLIGFALVDLQCTGKCGAPKAYGTLIGLIFAAGGVGIVGTLILRAMNEAPPPRDN